MEKQFHDQKSETVSGLSREGRCSSLAMPSGGYAVWADAVKEGDSGKTAYYAVLEAAGNAAAAGAVPLAVSARILLPPEAEEDELRELAAGIRAACDEMCLKASCIQGAVSHAVRMSTAVVTVTGAAEHDQEERVYPGQEILLCGCAGLEGTLRILDEAEDELRQRFVPSFLAGARAAVDEQNARVITSGEEVRYLDRPAPDELMRWQGMRSV